MSPRSPAAAAQLASQLDEVPAFRALLRAAEAALIAAEQPLEVPILDLGCGDRHFARHALAGVPTTGADPDLPALAEARRSGEGSLTAAIAAELPFADRTFATVIANSVLEHIPELEPALAEVARVLRPGGTLLLTAPGPRFGELLLVPRVLQRLRLRASARAYGRWFNRHSRHFNLLDVDEWRAALGRRELRVEESWSYFSPRAHGAFDLLHYLGAPTLLWRRLSGHWRPFPNPLRRAVAERLLAPLCDPAPHSDGAYLFVRARREGQRPDAERGRDAAESAG